MIKDNVFDPIHLDIAFHRLQPELLLKNVRQNGSTSSTPEYMTVLSNGWSDKAYIHYALSRNELHRTDDEARYMANHFEQRLTHAGRDDSVFEMLRRYSQHLLTSNGVEPLCRYECVLRWRKLTLSLGQDLFTTVYTAAEDIKSNRQRSNFNWPAIINTNNNRLSQLVAQGVSENHFHLTGSTRLFSLSWICMMNHPKRIHAFFNDKSVHKEFSERLNLAISGNPKEYLMSWQELILYAAYLRASLFARCVGIKSSDSVENDFLDEFDPFVQKQTSLTKDFVSTLRFSYGARIPQQNGRTKILDYALTPELDDCYGGHNRLLAGERHFLYMCFRNCFNCSFTNMEKDLFYLYLLIQNQFRSELIQVNDRIGFQNFARYQDRKGFFWESFPEYWDESIRLSVNATLQTGTVRSLEARMCPSKNPRDQLNRIIATDRAYGYAETGRSLNRTQLNVIADSPLFYVLHFPKNRKEIYRVTSSDTSRLSAYAYPRNSRVRRDTEFQAKSLAKALKDSSYLRKRIRGIDACSNEVGCRPETFATEFRFLRSGIPCNNVDDTHKDNEIQLAATYHAGEDFVDIIDGIRAVDEAFLFLELRRGDRLGHALALGVDPYEYYKLKNCKLVLPKQDLLDNLIWILFRTLEYGIDMPQSLRKVIEREATELMDHIGYDSAQYSLLEYFQAWRLRGDNPQIYQRHLYCARYFQCDTRPNCNSCPNCIRPRDNHPFWHITKGSYESFYNQVAPELVHYRNDERVQSLCWLYHYDYDIKMVGKEVVSYQIEPQIIDVVEKLQNKMQHCLMESGISIECNPSSNVLIGSFSKYRDHPMFRFNHYGIRIPKWDHEIPANLCVSINTDDQGVFDTSLESEYAYVARSMERELDENGERINSNDSIYAYLDHIRILGNSQTFHYKGNEIFFSKANEYQSFCNHLLRLGDHYDPEREI